MAVFDSRPFWVIGLPIVDLVYLFTGFTLLVFFGTPDRIIAGALYGVCYIFLKSLAGSFSMF